MPNQFTEIPHACRSCPTARWTKANDVSTRAAQLHTLVGKKEAEARSAVRRAEQRGRKRSVAVRKPAADRERMRGEYMLYIRIYTRDDVSGVIRSASSISLANLSCAKGGERERSGGAGPIKSYHA